MKYLVVEIQKFDAGQISTPTYAYDTQNAAEAKFHSILASAANSELPIHAAVLMTEEGYPLRHECYTHIIESEPESNPESE